MDNLISVGDNIYKPYDTQYPFAVYASQYYNEKNSGAKYYLSKAEYEYITT